MTSAAPDPGPTGFHTARDGTRLAVRRAGAGAPLILVHGTASDGRRWRPLLPFLQPRFDVLAVDRRGHGDSRDHADYAIEREFDDLIEVARAAGDGAARFIGHSFGALCVLGAACHAGVASRVVLYEPPLPARPDAYFSADLLPAMREAIARGDPEAAVAAFVAEVSGRPPASVTAAGPTALPPRLRERAAIILRELAAVEALSRAADRFAGCTADVLLVVGGASGPQYHDTASLLHRLLASSRVAILDGQGHGAIDAAPAMFADRALAFLGVG